MRHCILFCLILPLNYCLAKYNTTQYHFRYYVRDDITGDFKTQEETREGSAVRGSYSVAEPNGDLRTVTYTAAAGKGFEAIVDIKPGGSPMGVILNRTEKSNGKVHRVNTPLKFDDKTIEVMSERKFVNEPPTKKYVGKVRELQNVNFPPEGYVLRDQKLYEGSPLPLPYINENIPDLKGYRFETAPYDKTNSSENVEGIVHVKENQYSVGVRSLNKNDLDSKNKYQSYQEASFERNTFANKENYDLKYRTEQTIEQTTHNPQPEINRTLEKDAPTEIPYTETTVQVSKSSSDFSRENKVTAIANDGSDENSESFPNKTNKKEVDPIQIDVEKIIRSIPRIPELHLLDDRQHFYKDAEEAAIDARITEVARQLAETSLRQEYEDKKLAHIIPIRLLDKYDNKQTSTRKSIENHSRKDVAKSFEFPPKSLPLVGRLPVENAQLQLITEVQTVPHHVYREGFYQMTPAPELSGPLLGGPPLKSNQRSLKDDPLKPIFREKVQDTQESDSGLLKPLFPQSKIMKKGKISETSLDTENKEVEVDQKTFKHISHPQGKTLRFPIWDKTFLKVKSEDDDFTSSTVSSISVQPVKISETTNPLMSRISSQNIKDSVFRTFQPNGHQYPSFIETAFYNRQDPFQISVNQNRLLSYFKPILHEGHSRFQVLNPSVNTNS